MFEKNSGKTFLFIGSVLLAAAGIVLGALQYRWTEQIAINEKRRITTELKRNAGDALYSASDELRLVIALFQIGFHPEISAEGIITAIEENLEYWRDEASYPGLLEEVYAVVFSEREISETYTFINAKAEQRRLPDQYRSVVESLLQIDNGKELGDIIAQYFRSGTIFIPSRPLFDALSIKNMAGNEVHQQLLYICRIDYDYLFGSVLPDYLHTYLPGYPYSILDMETGDLIASDGEIAERSEPELTYRVRSPFLSNNQRLFLDENSRRTGKNTGDTEGGREEENLTEEMEIRNNPVVRFIFEKREAPFDLFKIGKGMSPIAQLEIFYPERSIDSMVSARRTANLIVSTGIVAVLLLSFITLSRLYLRMGELRRREQEFVASISHELRTPITVIKSSAGNLSEGLVVDEARVARYGEIIYKQSQRLARMVEGILTYSGLSSGGNMVKAEIDPQKFISEIISSLEESARQSGAHIEFAINNNPGVIQTYPMALRLAVENLVMNAVRHGLPDNADSLDHPTPIFITVDFPGPPSSAFPNPRFRNRKHVPGQRSGTAVAPKNTPCLRLTVEDRGKGVGKAEAGNLFDPFVRGENAKERQHPGTGLGLHLVKRVMSIINGSIILESPYVDRFGLTRDGCRFICEIPFFPIRNKES